MADNKRKASEIVKLMQQHGGQSDMQVEWVDLPNPDYDPSYDDRRTIKVKQVTWIAADGYRLTALDRGERSIGPDPGIPGAEYGDEPEPIVEVQDEGTPKKQDSRTDEAKRNEARLDAERQKNLDETGNWETDAERRRREKEEKDERERTEEHRRGNAIREREVAIREAESDRAGRREQADIEDRNRRSKIDEERLGFERERVDLEKDKYQFDRERANRPEIISKPTDADEQIAVFDPVSGRVTAQSNPLYNAAKVESERKKEELALGIQVGKYTQDQAAAEYTRWFKQNVEVPFMRAQEARAQAQEKRQALEAEERRREFKAQHDLGRAQLGQQAAGQMLDAEMALNPYRVGPAFGEQMGAAINSLAGGGSMGANASAGINFTADAFEYKKPDLDKIARKAVRNALKGVSAYEPSDEEFATADYSGINLPGADIMSTAPAMPVGPDLNQQYQDWRNSQYRYVPR